MCAFAVEPTVAKTLQAVIFDMDGVLTDSEPLICESAMAMFRELGLTVQAADFAPFVGTGENRYLGGVAEKYGQTIDLMAAKRRTYEIYLDLVPLRLKSFPGAVDLVKACRLAGFKTAVGSSADLIKVHANLVHIGLAPAGWSAVVTAEDVTRRKPDPDLFLKAAERMRVDPGACVVIEDAPSGIRAARAAGMRCVAVAQTFPASALTDADRVVARIAELRCEDLQR
jgi:beta-phosphoglucomutase